MSEKKSYPRFENETEEAKWLFEHQDELPDYFGDPLPSNPVPLHERLGLERTPKSQAISIRLLPEDIHTAKQIAEKKGIGYQTYLKMLIHESLEREKSAG